MKITIEADTKSVKEAAAKAWTVARRIGDVAFAVGMVLACILGWAYLRGYV